MRTATIAAEKNDLEAALAKTCFPEYIKDQIRHEFTKEKGNNRTSNTSSNLELPTRIKPICKNEGPTFNTPVRINIYSTRIRETDIDGISGKAALDGIVKSGILADDSPDQIESYQIHKPTISSEEKTVIEITEI